MENIFVVKYGCEMSFTSIFSFIEYSSSSSTDGLSKIGFINVSAQLKRKSMTFPKEADDR